MSTINFGQPSPSVENISLDSLFSTTLANYRKKLHDVISTSNACLHELMKPGKYESADSGTHIQENLMYALSPADSYSGFDELSVLPTDGMTAALFEFRNMAAPCAYSMDQVRANKSPAKLIDFVSSKIKQCELGLQEAFGIALLQGSGNGALLSPLQSGANGSFWVDPLGKIISPTPTSGVVGNIDPSLSTNAWWRNQAEDISAITKYDDLMLKMESMWIDCSLYTGGTPDLILMDPTSYKLFVFAQYLRFRQTVESIPNYPFEATKFKTAKVVADQKMPDFKSSLTSYATYGSAMFINSAFMKLRYDSSVNFEWLKDDKGVAFAKPINGDSRVGHMAWRGQITCSNRRKQGLLFGIPRTLTA